MLAEILIFVPSIAFFRQSWLNDRLAAAQLASLAADVTPESTVPEELKKELLRTAQVRMVALKRRDQRRLILSEAMETPVSASYDLRDSQVEDVWRNPLLVFSLMRDALMVFVTPKDTMIRVLGEPNQGAGDVIEVVMPIESLKNAMVRHGLNVLGISIIISFLTAVPVYLALNALFVKPMTRLTAAMVQFRAQPEDASRIIHPSDRGDELGTAERELAHMQAELTQTLAQKSHLAALGLAVSKINHDLRNLLANAQLLTDRLASLPDPQVQRLAPKLLASIDRAIRFCNDTLQYGRAAEPTPKREMFLLRSLVADVGDGLEMPQRVAVGWGIDVPGDLLIDADRDQLYRVLTNLILNAVQAIEGMAALEEVAITGAGGRSHVVVTGRRAGGAVVIDLRDTGPGLPEVARAHLFRAFQGSTRRGGVGLGLAIAQEIVVAHGGRIEVVVYGAGVRGTHFRIEIPDRTFNLS
ncbi:MAG: HAMP domain-containing histidine kinase [Hyphomicrobiaceae bacterium]|nr:HAMP domain-containing histidine kinase [Hyphomicrobiaceae bacterium]